MELVRLRNLRNPEVKGFQNQVFASMYTVQSPVMSVVDYVCIDVWVTYSTNSFSAHQRVVD